MKVRSSPVWISVDQPVNYVMRTFLFPAILASLASPPNICGQGSALNVTAIKNPTANTLRLTRQITKNRETSLKG